MAKDIRKQAREVEQDIEDRIEANELRLIHIGSGILLFVAGAGITALLVALDPIVLRAGERSRDEAVHCTERAGELR